MSLTSDPNDPRIKRGSRDTEPTPQHEVYLVLSDEERAKGFVRPLRVAYRHLGCGSVTTMGIAIAETYARQPAFLRGDLLRALLPASAGGRGRRVRLAGGRRLRRAEGRRLMPSSQTTSQFHMPPELVEDHDDCIVAYLRIDGPEDTRGKAQAAFASEWGVDFTDIRVTKTWFSPPEPECDECSAPATCGIAAKWADGGPAFKEKVCDQCQAESVAREGIFARCESVEAKTLAEVTPYDGWPVSSAKRGAAGAVAYWHGEER